MNCEIHYWNNADTCPECWAEVSEIIEECEKPHKKSVSFHVDTRTGEVSQTTPTR